MHDMYNVKYDRNAAFYEQTAATVKCDTLPFRVRHQSMAPITSKNLKIKWRQGAGIKAAMSRPSAISWSIKKG